MIYKNYIHKLEDLSSIDPRHLVFRQETVAWLTPAVHQECDQLQKGHHGENQESMVLRFYVLFYSVWIQFRLNFL